MNLIKNTRNKRCLQYICKLFTRILYLVDFQYFVNVDFTPGKRVTGETGS